MRTRKNAEVRKAEILAAAAQVFKERGYADSSIETIIERVGISKGAFYHHFESKAALLSELVASMTDSIVFQARSLASEPGVAPADKLGAVLAAASRADEGEGAIGGMHREENRELHLLIMRRLVLELAPVLADIVSEGAASGDFRCDRPLETVQFILAGGQFLMDEAYFEWSDPEYAARLAAIQAASESALGLGRGRLGIIGMMGKKPKSRSAKKGKK